MKPSPVINSSPLIALVAALPDFDALSEIVEKLIVPAEVIAELAAGGHKDDTAACVQAAPWCEVLPPMSPQFNPLLSTLGSGEAAVIQTAIDHDLPLVIIDEVRGLDGHRITRRARGAASCWVTSQRRSRHPEDETQRHLSRPASHRSNPASSTGGYAQSNSMKKTSANRATVRRFLRISSRSLIQCSTFKVECSMFNSLSSR